MAISVLGWSHVQRHGVATALRAHTTYRLLQKEIYWDQMFSKETGFQSAFSIACRAVEASQAV